ncbi:MAG: hypothetical protein KDB61_00170 [Planctomycetes bacterium]|nr:hypothetical protein [Planctomycetota bacterium]
MSNLLASGTLSRSCAPVLALTFGALFSAPAQGQSELIFSVDWQGQTTGEPDSFGGLSITDADLLLPVGGPFPTTTTPLDKPGILLPGSFLQAYTACLGHLPGQSCGLELNALSFGRDALLQPNPMYRFRLYFSVDEFAVGEPSATPWGTVFSEAQLNEAAADVFVSNFQGLGPFAPGLTPGANSQVVDGDGRRNNGTAFNRGLGLEEPNLPGSALPDTGSNLDALSMGAPFSPLTDKVYFSLEGGIADPLESAPVQVNSAQIQGFQSGDILVYDPGTGQVSQYASADDLGLDNLGIGTDDVDAIAVVEANGIPGFQRPNALYDWQPGPGGGDLVLFSVRRGSAVIGTPDSLLGLPIVPGDVLIAPFGLGFMGTTPPGIFAAAETLGLHTDRLLGLSDELDALELMGEGEDPFVDCNNNGEEDSKDIANGSSPDDNINGIPDECEDPGHPFCDCKTATNAPCGGNAGLEEGCKNNTGLGGKLVVTGQSSIATDNLIFTSSQLSPNEFGILLMGDGAIPHSPLDNGLRCVHGTSQGFRRLDIQYSGPAGTFTHGPGILGIATSTPHNLIVLSGTTWYFQTWYRDHFSYCTYNSNMTNGWEVTFTP